jgi:hypothetical protein
MNQRRRSRNRRAGTGASVTASDAEPGLRVFPDFARFERAKTAIDGALVAAYHLQHVEGGPSFTLEEIRGILTRVGVRLPVNFPDVVYRAIRRGFMAETGLTRGGYRTLVLTEKGKDHVARILEANPA